MEGKNKDFKANEILKMIVSKNDDRIEVITTATSEPADTEKSYSKIFKHLGYSNFGFLYITDGEKSDPEVLERVKNAKTIFFSGGDQCKICEILRDTEVEELIHKKYDKESGFVVAGTSAGAMCMGSVMIGGAENGEAILANDIDMDKGLGFLNCIIDTHFVSRGRFGRLAHANVLDPELLGIGLGEDTALIVENGNVATCRGSGIVILLDAKHVKKTNAQSAEKGHPVYAENIIVNIVTDGCQINLSDGSFNSEKIDIK